MAAAPTGWTRDTTATLNDSAIKLLGSETFAPGGATAFSTVHPATTYSFTSSGSGGGATGTTSTNNIDLPLHTHTGTVTGAASPIAAPGVATITNAGWSPLPGPNGGTTVATTYMPALPIYTSSSLIGPMSGSPTSPAGPTNTGAHSHPYTMTTSYTGSTSATANMNIRYVDVLIATKNNISYSSQTATSIARGNSVTFVFNTVSTGQTTFYYRVVNTGLTSIISNSTGSVAAGASTTSITITVPNPASTSNPATTGYDEGGGSFILEFRADSVSGPILAMSQPVTVTEPVSAVYTLPNTSMSPFGFGVSLTRPYINPTMVGLVGSTMLSITATNRWPRGGTWRINHITTTASDFLNVTSGPLNYTYGILAGPNTPIYTANFYIYLGASVELGNNTFTISFYTNKGTLIGTTTTITLQQPTTEVLIDFSLYSLSMQRGARYKFNTAPMIPGGALPTAYIEHISTNSSDFNEVAITTTGQDNGLASSAVYITPATRLNWNSSAETFQFYIMVNNARVNIDYANSGVKISPTFTIQATTTALVSPQTTIIEGQTARYNIATTGIPNGTVIGWKVYPSSPTIGSIPATSADFVAMTGKTVINNNSAYFYISTVPSSTTDSGLKTFGIELVEPSDLTTTITTNAATVTITDLYKSGLTFNFITPPTTILEGKALTLQFEAINTSTGFLYWTIDGISSTAGDFTGSVIQGTVNLSAATVVNSTPVYTKYLNTFTITSAALDSILETDETFTVSLRSGGLLTSPILATSATMTIVSVEPKYFFVNGTVLLNSGSSISGTSPFFINEGAITSFTVGCDNITSALVYWDISYSSPTVAGDFTGTVSGSFTISPTTPQQISLSIVADAITDGDKTFSLNVRSSLGGPILTSFPVTIRDTSKIPTYRFVNPTTSIDENPSTTTYTVATTDLAPTTLYWIIRNISTSAPDFTATTSGSFITSGTTAYSTGSFQITTIYDTLTEGKEEFVIEVRSGSVSGTLLATSIIITVIDTSINPTYNISAPALLINEGSPVSYTVETTSVFLGTILYYNTIPNRLPGSVPSGLTSDVSDFIDQTYNVGVVSLVSGNYLSIPTTSTFALGTAAWTIECWVIIYGGVSGTQQIICDWRDADNAVLAPVLYALSDGTGYKLKWRYGGVDRITSSIYFPGESSGYTHVAITRIATSGTTRMFINGVLVGSFADTGNYVTGATFKIGKAHDTNYFTGIISNFRIVKGTSLYPTALTAPSISFTIPTSPLTAVNGTLLLACQGPAVTSDNSGGNLGVPWNITYTGGTLGTNFGMYLQSGPFFGSSFDSVRGSFMIGSGSTTNGTGVFTITPLADVLSEGDETMQLQIRTGSNSGPIVATSPVITITDTSTSNPVGQIEFTSAGLTLWTVPLGVYSISVVAVGGGGGGGCFGGGGAGGALAYANNISVIPGEVYAVSVGSGGAGSTSTIIAGVTGGGSFFKNSTFLLAPGGGGGSSDSAGEMGGGGGAGGYSGGGGYSGLPNQQTSSTGGNGTAPSGTALSGGGMGGGGGNYSTNAAAGIQAGSPAVGGGAGAGAGGVNWTQGGGGVGIYGQGAIGATPPAMAGNTNPTVIANGGSGGTAGILGNSTGTRPDGGGWGGGGGAGNGYGGGSGARGAVRIIWPGNTRQFPSTNTANM